MPEQDYPLKGKFNTNYAVTPKIAHPVKPIAPKLQRSYTYHDLVVALYLGDIAGAKATAIVNASNQWLHDGGGVTGAIWRASSDELIDAYEDVGFCPTGDIRVIEIGQIDPGHIASEYVIHATAPQWELNRERQCMAILKEQYVKIFETCDEYSLSSVALPILGTGHYNVPFIQGYGCFLQALSAFDSLRFTGFSKGLEQVQVVLYDEMSYHVAKSMLSDLAG